VLGVRELREGDPLPEVWRDFSLRSFARALFEPSAETAQAHVTPGNDRICAVIGIPANPPATNAIVVVADLSEQARREHAEREFVANAAHELRTPLTTILGATEVLQSGAKDDPLERDHFIALIERESNRLARLARALLVLARAQTRSELPQLTPVEILPMLEEIAAGLRPRTGVHLSVDCEADVTALADPDLAEQALRNVAENAVKNTRRGSIVLHAYHDNGNVTVEVRDTGRGMTEAHRQRIFDRFYRADGRDSDGFGLGLAIVEQAVRVLGGAVEVESEPGTGTTVRLELTAAGAGRR
jgi:signal transduction histidine kinase